MDSKYQFSTKLRKFNWSTSRNTKALDLAHNVVNIPPDGVLVLVKWVCANQPLKTVLLSSIKIQKCFLICCLWPEKWVVVKTMFLVNLLTINTKLNICTLFSILLERKLIWFIRDKFHNIDVSETNDRSKFFY